MFLPTQSADGATIARQRSRRRWVPVITLNQTSAVSKEFVFTEGSLFVTLLMAM
ncbi:hypothetical protein OK016_01165 [Vibrio chagasii]|nr:hypothetical protein [Vibrio chagasii]